VGAVIRACLIAALIGTLISAPVQASSSKPLGTITQAQATWIDRSAAAVGTTVYPGDTLKTDDNGSIRMRAGLAQLYMMSASEARLEDASKGIRASLLKGTAGFSSGPSDIVEFNALGVVIRSLDGQPAHGRVSIVGANQLVVTSFHGPFEVAYDGDTHAIADGSSYRLTLADPDKPSEQGNGTEAVRSRKKVLMIVLITAGIIAAGFISWAVYDELTESPSKPKPQ
jgi:hypothetical protein